MEVVEFLFRYQRESMLSKPVEGKCMIEVRDWWHHGSENGSHLSLVSLAGTKTLPVYNIITYLDLSGSYYWLQNKYMISRKH